MSPSRFSKILVAVLALVISSGAVYAGVSPIQVNGGNPIAIAYVPGWAGSLTATVTLANGGTPGLNFNAAAPAGVTIAPGTGVDVDSTPSLGVTLTQAYAMSLVSASTPTNNFTVTLTDNNGDTCTVTINLTYVGTPLTADGPLYKITFTKGSTPVAAQGHATVRAAEALGSVGSMQLDAAYPVPSWLTVTVPASITSGGTQVTFDTTPAVNVINTWAPGHYTVTVGIKSATCTVCAINFQVDMVIQPATANTVTMKGVSAGQQVATNPINVAWTSGNTVSAYVYSSSLWPAFTATCSTATTNDKVAALTYTIIPCTLTLAGTTSTSVSGLATVSGTPITVTWDTNLLDTATHGAKYNDTVDLTIHIATQPGVTAPADLVFHFTLLPPSPTITGISPGSTPALANSTDQLVLTVTGTNLVCTSCIKGGSQTRVFVGNANPPNTLEPAGVLVQVISPTTMKLTVTGANLPSAGASTKFYISVANQSGVTPPAAPTATVPTGVGSGTMPNPAISSISVSTNPAILGITNSASYVQPTASGALPKVSPYELISIFGVNFEPTGSPLTVATPNASGLYTTALTVTGSNVLQVKFSTSSTMTNPILAPILFATTNQINCIVPGGVTAGVPMYVTVSYGTTTAPSVSVAFPVSVAAADPGIFTLDASGSGPAAIINFPQGGGAPTINGSGEGLAAAASGDVISIYATGLGAPNNPAATTTGAVYFTSCVTPQAYNTAAGISTFDGAVLLSNKLNNHLPPCFVNTAGQPSVVTVTFNCTSGGGAATTVNTTTSAHAYAGFVADSVEGLDQINVTVPAGLASGACPITISNATSGTPASQAGATIQIEEQTFR